MKFFLALCFTFFLLLTPINAKAIGIDLLGEVTSPLIGPAKDKVKGMLRYIWLQPYGGYATGNSDQKRTATSGATTVASDLSVEGIMYGARGGLLLANTFRLGLDFSLQSADRSTLVETTSATYVQQPVSGKNSMLGLCFGFDIPRTPLQGFASRYFKATLQGDGASGGDGWGYGVSFMLKNPFLLLIEQRKLNYSSAADPTGKKAEATVSQYYFGLSFMLL